MGLLTRDQILATTDIHFEDVDVPEWGGAVRVRGMTGTERSDFEAASLRGRGKNVQVNYRNLRERLVVMCVVDEDGQRLFGDDDVRALGRKSARPIDRIFEVASRLSGLDEEDVKELTEDFEQTPGDSSTSD